MELNFSKVESQAKDAEKQIEKVLILGAGPAGLSAALYAARAELNPLVLIGTELGGQASLTFTIENYPGFPDGVGGAELGELFKKQAERFGARFEYDMATAVDLNQRPFVVKTYSKEIQAETVIVATGASPYVLNVPGRIRISDAAYLTAPPATAGSLRTKSWWWLAVGTVRWKKRCS